MHPLYLYRSLAFIHAEFEAPRPGIVIIDDITHGAGVAGHPPITRYTRSHCLGATGLAVVPPRCLPLRRRGRGSRRHRCRHRRRPRRPRSAES